MNPEARLETGDTKVLVYFKQSRQGVNSLREKKAHGWTFWSFADRCDRTAPTPVSEASTSTMNWRSGSGKMRIGAKVKRVFKSLNAFSASEDHRKGMLGEVRVVSGVATEQ